MNPVGRHQPEFESLPDTGAPGMRWVGTQMMDRHQYLVEGWHVVDEYPHPVTRERIHVWCAVLDGLRRSADSSHGDRSRRIAAVRARDEADAAFWAQVTGGTVTGASP